MKTWTEIIHMTNKWHFVTLPADLLQKAGIREGDEVELSKMGLGLIMIRKPQKGVKFYVQNPRDRY